jgi:hypothetical protein
MPPENDQPSSTATPADASTGQNTPAGSTGTPPPADTPSQGAASARGEATAKANEAPKSALEAVKAVMAKDRASAADSATASQAAASTDKTPAAGTEKSDAQQPAGDGRLTNDEFKALPPKAQARFNAMYKEAKTFETRLKAAEPKAQIVDDLQKWASENSVSQEEYAYSLEFIAAVKNDPTRAWKMVQPLLADLRKHVGEELPEDLASEVTAGTISRERAQELAATRAEQARLREQGERRIQQDASTQQRAAVQQQINQHTAAISAYESQWKSSDPDYALKQPRVWERMVTLMNEQGKPTSSQAAVALLKQAREDVEKWMGGFVPKPKAKDTLPAAGSNPQTQGAPKSALDAARRAIAA